MSLVLAPAPPPEPGPDRIRSVIALLPDYIDLAGRISATEFVPKALQRRPEAVLAALMSGAERGLGPMESLRSIHIIEGRPTLSAEIQRALVLAAGHEIVIVEQNAQRATLQGRRRGSDSTSPEFTWTIDRARRARLLQKDNWVKYPEGMLLARASSELCRAVFPDVIAGLPSTEEVSDEAGPPAPTTRRSRSLGEPQAPPAVGPAPAAGGTPEEPPTPPEMPWEEASAGGGSEDDGKRPADATLARRLHAEMSDTFPDVRAMTRDRWRHALCAVVTRKRDDGPMASAGGLDYAEQMELSRLLVNLKGGQATIAEAPDGMVELRVNGGWLYTVNLAPPVSVTLSRGGPGAGAGTPDSVPSAPAPANDEAPPWIEEPLFDPQPWEQEP